MTGYGKYGSPGVCRCCGCTIYGDEFTSDTLAANWEEVAGDWTIAGGLLSIDETDAVLIADQVHPDGDRVPQVLTVKVRLSAVNDVARLIIAYDDSDNYLFAEFWIDADGCCVFEAFERIGGVDTSLGQWGTPFEIALDEWHTLTLCYVPGESSMDPGSLTVKAESVDAAIGKATFETSADLPGDQAGVGSGDTAAEVIEFDDFDYQYYYDEETHPDCPQCEGETGCELHNDNFNREVLGCAWEQVAGDWSIDTNQLTIDEEDAILRNRTAHPEQSTFVQVQFKFRSEADVVILVILDWTDDTNFFYVRLEPGSHGDCGRVSFWRKTAGVDTQVGMDGILLGMSADVAETHTVTVCWTGDFVKATLTPAAATDYGTSSHAAAPVVALSPDPYVGLGTGTGGGTNQVWFDDFTLKKIQQEDVDETCEECNTMNCVLYFNNPHEDATSFPTTFNCLWTIVVGGWTMNSFTSSNAITLFALATTGGTAYNELIEIDDDNAMLINETGHPLITGEGFLDFTSGAEVEVISFNYGDIIRLLIGVEDDQNYLYAEWEWAADDESTGFLRVGKVVAGTDTELDEQASSVLAGQPQGDHNASVVDQLPSILRVCYDGFEIRANFTNLADVAITSSNKTSASANAGVGWNPGKSGLATGAIAASIYFAGFRFFHDIFGGDINCAPCDLGLTCGFCVETVGMIEEDRTPPIMLVQMQNLAPDVATGCDEANQFNDTFALPFFSFNTTGTTSCSWLVRPHFCDAPTFVTTGLVAQVNLTIEKIGPSLDITTTSFRPRVRINAYDPGGSGPSYNSTFTDWEFADIAATAITGYEDDNGFDCSEYFANWITSNAVNPNGPFAGASWLVPGGTSDPSTARFKVLA